MKSKENNLEKNISRLVKLAGDSNEPSEAFADSVVKDALAELKGTKAEREGNDKFVKVKWKRTLSWAAVVLVVCGIGFGILISNAGKTRKTTGVDFSGGSNELVAKDSGAELVVEETTPHEGFAADSAYENLKVFNFKGLDMSISQSEPNDNMLLAAREARAAKPVDMVKPKPVLQKLPQEPEHIVRVQASEALRKLTVQEDAVARKKIRKEPEQAVENNKPIAHWAFEEGRGSTAYDWVGNSHGTIHGAKWTAGKVGRALSFDGVDDYVRILDATDPTAYTLTAWVNPNNASAQGIIVRTSPRGPIREWSHQLLISSSGKFEHYLYCADGTPLAVTSESPIVVDTWYHVTAVAENNGNMRLYVNGEEQGTAQRIGWLWKGGDQWYVGSNASGLEYFKGLIDEVAIYNRALSAKEIRRLYQQRTSGLVAHWKFDEGSGTVAHDSIGDNHGTIHGAKWTTGRVGGALSFDGVDDYVDFGNAPLFDITGPITLAAWVKTSSGSSVWQGIVTKGEVLWKIQKHVSGSGDFECWGLIGTPHSGPYLSTVGVNMNDGQWHHIAGTYDGAAMRIYWDGVLNNSLSVSGTINTGGDPVYIGGVYGKPEYGFPGIIDEVAIYNRALSAEEIRQLYKYGSPDQVKQSLRKPAEPSAWLVTMTPLGVMFEFRPPVGSSGWVDMELYEHGGEMLTAFSCPHSGEPIQIWLAEPVDQNDPAKYYLRYRIRTTDHVPKWRAIGLSRMPRTTGKTSDEEYAAIVQAIKDVLPAFPRCPVGEPNLPMPHEVLISYSKRSRIPMAKIEAVMVDLVRKHWQPQGSDPHSISQHRLAIRVIAVLGELRTLKALPVLNQVVESDNQDIRVTATRAIIKIGGENLLPFVRHVFCERKRFSWYERFLMYEQFSPYIGLQTWRPALLEDKESFKVNEDLRAAVLQFLINAVYADITSSGNTQRLDKMLCLVSDDYKFSYERENVLNRLEQAWTKFERQAGSEWARAYPTEQLKILRALPAEKRTHVEIQEIKSNTWQLPIEKAVEPSAWLVTLTPLGVMFEFRPPAGSSGWVDMELYEHGGEMLTAFSRPHSGEPVLIWLAVSVDQNDPAKYYLRYRIRITAAPLPKWRVVGVSRMPKTTRKTSDKNTSSTSGPVKNTDVKLASPHGPMKDGLAAFLICQQKQFKVGEPIPVMYGVVYGGPDEKVTILAPPVAVDPGNISWLSITGPDGNDVPYMGIYVTFPLPDPKDALQLRRRRFYGRLAYNIRDSFKLCTPGTYTIKWHCEMRPVDGVSCWTGELVSNEIQIEIVP